MVFKTWRSCWIRYKVFSEAHIVSMRNTLFCLFVIIWKLNAEGVENSDSSTCCDNTLFDVEGIFWSFSSSNSWSWTTLSVPFKCCKICLQYSFCFLNIWLAASIFFAVGILNVSFPAWVSSNGKSSEISYCSSKYGYFNGSVNLSV